MTLRFKTILLAGGLILGLTGIFIPTQTFAEGFAGQAGAFLRMGAGAVAVAGGEAGVARSMGVEQTHYNAAGLPFSPGNEVHAGYHFLSLDRRLSHVGLLYQVPELSFWSGDLRPLELRRSIEGESLPALIIPGSLPGRRGQIYKVEDYLDPLVNAIIEYVNREDFIPGDDFVPQLRIESIEVTAPALTELVKGAVLELKGNISKQKEDVLTHFEQNYRTTRYKPAAAALTWTHAGTDNIDGRTFDGRNYGTLGYFENRFALSFGLKVHRKISLGITAGVLYALFPDILEGDTKSLKSTTFGADLGAQVRPFLGSKVPYRLETLSLGVAVYDIAAKNSWNTKDYYSQGTEKTDYYPKRYRCGFAYKPIYGLETFLDLETDLDKLLRPKGGVEYQLYTGSSTLRQENPGTRPAINNSRGIYGLALRAGFDRDRPTFGLGLALNLKGLGESRLDYAYVIEPVSPEPTQIISWRFRI